MDDEQRVSMATADDSYHSVEAGNYNFLLRLSRHLGAAATRSSNLRDVRNFMNHEVTYDTLGRWLAGDKKLKKVATKNNVSRSAKKMPAEDIKQIASRSHEIIASANTVFPLTLFPDTVTIDRTKVTITKRDFFWSADVLSIRIEDVLNVAVSVGPLFGSLTIASRVMSTVDHFTINHFWRNDAIRLKLIIQGYVIAQHNKIDISNLGQNELIETLMELGHDS